MLKLDEPFRDQGSFIISLFSTVKIWVLRVKSCLQLIIWLIICPFDDPHIFADPDLGSQNLADPKHWIKMSCTLLFCGSDQLYICVNFILL